METALESLPEKFPAHLAESITGGVRARLKPIGRSSA